MPAYVTRNSASQDIDSYYEYSGKIFETLKPYGGRVMAANDAEVREGRSAICGLSSASFRRGEGARVV